MRGLRMPLNFWQPFVGALFPEDLSCLFVEGIDLPDMFRIILYGGHVTIQSVARLVLSAAGNGSSYEDFVTPDDGAGMSEPGYLSLPTGIERFLRIPRGGRRTTFDDSGGAGATKLRPVLGVGSAWKEKAEGDQKEGFHINLSSRSLVLGL